MIYECCYRKFFRKKTLLWEIPVHSYNAFKYIRTKYIPFRNEIKVCIFLHPFSLQIAIGLETVVKFFHSRHLETDTGSEM
jgi:hypothetical protein